MRTIFRYTSMGLLLAAVIGVGAMASFAQDDPCADAATRDALDKTIRDNSASQTQEGRKKFLDAGKEFSQKFGKCETGVNPDFLKWLEGKLPKTEKIYNDEEIRLKRKGLEDKFFNGLKSKNWNDVYAAGKELLAADPETYRPAELVLGSIGLDETAKTPRVTTWNNDTLTYAKMALADIEAGKSFAITVNGTSKDQWGFVPFVYTSKSDAIGWMNYTIGYILSFDKNDKRAGAEYLFKATQVDSATKDLAEVYRSIGSYYIDELNKRIEEMKGLVAAQNVADPDDVKAQKIDGIKAKQAIINGTAERALEAYAHAVTLAKAKAAKDKDPQMATFANQLNDRAKELYNIRFGKPDGFDAWMAAANSRTLADPKTDIAPITDPTPAPSTTGAASKPAAH